MKRLGLAAGVVTLGFSQVFFNVLLRNPNEFPRQGVFHLWVLFWTTVLPLLIVLGADLLLARGEAEGRLARAWRALLYSAAALSFARQVQVYQDMGGPWIPVFLVVGAGVFALGFRFHRAARLYVSLLGILAALLVGIYVHESGLLGPAWTGSRKGDPRPAEERSAPPVFVILFDELAYEVLVKDGGVDEREYPNLARLASGSAWFRNATTNHHWTQQAIPTLLSGRMSPAPDAPLLFDALSRRYRFTFLDTLGIAGRWAHDRGREGDVYYFRGHPMGLDYPPIEVARLLWAGLIHSPLVRLDAGPPPEWNWETMGHWLFREVDLVLENVDAKKSSGRLLYWHCPLPHPPYVFDAEGNLHGRGPTSFGLSPPDLMERTWGHYLDQVRLADRLLGRFLDRLEEAGLYSRCFLFVTSDHGVRTGGWRDDPGFPDVRSGLTPRVPLFVHGPGVKPGAVDVDYQHIDFVPTVLDVLGLDPGGYEGVSAFAPERPDRTKIFEDRGRRYVHDPAADRWRRE